MEQVLKRISLILLLSFSFEGCKMLAPVKMDDKVKAPSSYSDVTDTTNSGRISWREFFTDSNLVSLIDTALKNNLELMSTLQDIEIARNEVLMKKGMILPMVEAGAGAGMEKVGRYTSQGAGDASADITPGHVVPENLGNLELGLRASWEIDIWKKLRNSRNASYAHYLSTMEGKNFVVTSLVAEIADSYYELVGLDQRLDIVRQTIKLQQNALEIVKIQKEASEVNELAVKKFEAEVLSSQSLEYDILQQIQETENRINFLLGRYPQPVKRSHKAFTDMLPQQVKTGIPSQLLMNRPDVKQAYWELYATKCEVKEAQAEFYPSFTITGGVGFEAFKPVYLLKGPESLMYSIIGDLAAPLINRSAIKAHFNQAKAYQLKALYDYQQSILNGYVEVSNELSGIRNLQQLYDLKSKEVDTLTASVDISNELFKSARVGYFEVLMTQRDALDARLELVEVKKRQFDAVIGMYRSLGGGWK